MFDEFSAGREKLWVLLPEPRNALKNSPEWQEKVGARIDKVQRKGTRLFLFELPEPTQ